MSRRLQIMLPDPVATQLEESAAAAGEPLATIARQIVRDGVLLPAKSGGGESTQARAECGRRAEPSSAVA